LASPLTRIQLLEKEVAGRRSTISKLVQPIVRDRRRIVVQQLGAFGDYVLGVVPHGTEPMSIADPALLRVPTTVDGIFFNYHEVWRPVVGSSSLFLKRAYLHLHLKSHRDDPDQQLLALHCEPALIDTTVSAAFKMGPHLHVRGASPAIDSAHLSLCINDDRFGGDSADSLTATLSNAVQLIRLEVLPQYEMALR
jgi:hypothetical protein